jgi:phosphodiesterase/alkaline phosphatase D-like protein
MVSLSGDFHAHFAGEVVDDFDADPASQRIAMVEAVSGAISSVSQFTAVERLSRRDMPTSTEAMVRELITYDSRLSSNPGNNAIVNNLNNTLLNGSLSAQAAVQTNDLTQVSLNKDPAVNSHLKYADTDAHGYGLATIDADQMNIELVTITNITNSDPSLSTKKRSTSFIIPHTSSGQSASISQPEFNGQPPFPFDHE